MIQQSMRHRRAPRITMTIVLLLASAFACTKSNDDRSRELAGAPAQRLVGVWTVAFHLDRPMMLARTPTRRDVSGTIALIENHSGSPSFAVLPAALHQGTFDIDFTPFGFDPRERGDMPTAVGRTAADSVEIVLAPEAAHITVLMHGRLSGDSISGTWTALSHTAGGGGQFVMRRR